MVFRLKSRSWFWNSILIFYDFSANPTEFRAWQYVPIPLETFAIFYATVCADLPGTAGGMSLSTSETAASEPLRHL